MPKIIISIILEELLEFDVQHPNYFYLFCPLLLFLEICFIISFDLLEYESHGRLQ